MSANAQNAQQSARRRQLPQNRIVAIVIWMLGAYLTGIGIMQMRVVPEVPSMAIGIGVQLAMTFLESPIWRRWQITWVTGVALFFDAFFNFGGIWQFASKLDQTNAWASIVDASQMSQQQGLPQLAKIGIAIALSVVLAATPEYLWRE